MAEGGERVGAYGTTEQLPVIGSNKTIVVLVIPFLCCNFAINQSFA